MNRSAVVAAAQARGERYDRFLAGQLPELSRSRLQALIEAGHVTVDGVAIKAGGRVRGSETVVVEIPDPVSAAPQPQALPITILYEDAELLIVDKAPGMVVHPGAGHADGTLVNALLHHVDDLSGVGGELRPGIVHRLDKDTSGVMVIAKHERSLAALQKAFSSRTVEKTYLAIVFGRPPERGTFRTLHGRHPVHRQRFTGTVKTGKPAVTHYQVARWLDGAALVEVTLETGRTHQIRVHFSEAGFPLLADPIYGTRASSKVTAAPRLALHAHRLSFAHPRTKKVLTFEAPLPPDLVDALARLTPTSRR